MGVNVALFSNINVYFDVGLDSDNKRQYIDMTLLPNEIEAIDAIVGMYNYTGCDYSPASCNKGNITRLKLMLRKENLLA